MNCRQVRSINLRDDKWNWLVRNMKIKRETEIESEREWDKCEGVKV